MSFQLLNAPASIGRVLDSGFKLYVSSFKQVFGLVVLAAIISVIMQYAMMQVMAPDQPITTIEQSEAYMAQAMPVIMGLGVVIWVFSIIVYNAILVRVGDIALGRQGDVVDALLTGLKKTLPVFIGFVLYGLAVMAGFVLLVIPGFILMLTLLFFQVLIVLDNEGVIASLKGSHRLVWGNYWRTTAVIMIPLFVIYALVMVVAFVAGAMAVMNSPEAIDATMPMKFGVVDALSAAIPAFMISLMYSIYIVHVNDLKLRKSGADLQQRLQG